MGFKRTGRACAEPGCGGKLTDCVLDWGDALPEGELRAAERAADAAGLALCLGTSLQIMPACNLPLRTLRKGAAYFQALWLQECQVSSVMAVRNQLRAGHAPAHRAICRCATCGMVQFAIPLIPAMHITYKAISNKALLC